MSVTLLASVPALTSRETVVVGIIQAAARGFPVYITASLYRELKDVFEELGIKVQEHPGDIPDKSYILLSKASNMVVIEIHDGGDVKKFTMPIKHLVSSLREILAKKKGGKAEAPSLYRVLVPEDLIAGVENTDGNEER